MKKKIMKILNKKISNEEKSSILAEYLNDEIGLNEWMEDDNLKNTILEYLEEYPNDMEEIINEIDEILSLSGNGWFD